MNSQDNKTVPRPPIVAILGHIDHGKSTLLDHIRQSNVTAGEHGGITQHIKAYEAEVEIDGKKKKITFLDTPGHEAFGSVRIRGSSIADIAILIISAEDGVKPQTIESIRCVKESGIPFLVAINKIDKTGANPDKVKQELAEHEVLVEGWGGNVPLALISAKTGEGVQELLETLILQAEVEGIAGDPEGQAQGFVIDSEKDPKKGIVASLIIKNGSLKKGEFVVSGRDIATIRMIENYAGKQINEASLSQPIRISGWSEMPKAGTTFQSFSNRVEAESAAANYTEEEVSGACQLGTLVENQKVIPIIIKADATGSIEAIKHELSKLVNEKISIKVISEGVGPVSLNDVKLSIAAPGSVVLCFNVGTESTAKSLALRSNVNIQSFKIIYDLLDWMREKMTNETPTEQILEVVGIAKILKTFSRDKNKQVVGGRMEMGSMKQGDTVKISRRESEVGEGKVKELQMQKIKIGKVDEGNEFGALIESKIEVVPGDKIVSYQLVTK